MKKILSIIGLGLLVGLMLMPQPAAATDVGLELSLLVDISGSVDNDEFLLQRNAYAAVFKNPTFYSNIVGTGSLAANFIYWSGAAQQTLAVNWMLINDQASATAFGDAILATSRPAAYNLTAPGSAINYAVPLFASNTFDAPKQVIDVSGDGAQNDGANTAAARTAALAAGIDQINGLVILGEAGLEAWYNANVKGGTGAFVDTAANFTDFANAIDDKITKEIVGVPEPGTLILLGCALAGLYGIRRKIS